MNNLDGIFKRYPIVGVYLFGSRGRNQSNINSDYDFGIILQERIPGSEIVNIKLCLLKELFRHLKRPVDIIIMNYKGVPLSLKFRIIKEGKIVYEQDGLERGRFETRIFSLYLDRKYYYERHINEAIKKIAQRGIT